MPRTLRLALAQMDVKPAPTGERLERADCLVSDAEPFGIDLLVLPELFNTGYAYSDENFQRAEPVDGPTMRWMKNTARQLHIHLAGSILLREEDNIFNAMLIVAPDGRFWRYDKSYPWACERGYFRPNRASGAQRAVVARTEIGDLGMLICWDVAHRALWQAYAGRVDMMVVCSSPPMVSCAIFSFPDGRTVTAQQAGPVFSAIKGSEDEVFIDMVAQQAAWLGVPAANAVTCGRFESMIPEGKNTLLSMLATAPWLAGYMTHAQHMKITASMTDASKVFNREGKLTAHIPQAQGESFTVAEVALPEAKAAPKTEQPQSRAPWLAYVVSDMLLPRIAKPVYERGVLKYCQTT